MSRRRNHGKFCVSNFWRGDTESTKRHLFLTLDDAWAYVKGNIRKTDTIFSADYPEPSDFNYESIRKDLFCNGQVTINYHKNRSLFDTFQLSIL